MTTINADDRFYSKRLPFILRHARRFTLFDHLGMPLFNAAGIWPTKDLVATFAESIYGPQGWALRLHDGFSIRPVTISEVDTSQYADVDFLLAARRCLTEPGTAPEVIGMAAMVVESIDRDPQMLALAADVLRTIEGAAPASRAADGDAAASTRPSVEGMLA